MPSASSMHPWCDRHGRDGTEQPPLGDTGHGGLTMYDEVLPSEDIAVLSAFLEQPSGPMTDTLLSARTLLPFLIVTDRVKRLADAGLLVQGEDYAGRVTYDLGPRPGRAHGQEEAPDRLMSALAVLLYAVAVLATVVPAALLTLTECQQAADPAPSGGAKRYVLAAVLWDVFLAGAGGLAPFAGQRVASFELTAALKSRPVPANERRWSESSPSWPPSQVWPPGPVGAGSRRTRT